MYLITLSFVFIFLQITEISSLKCTQYTIHNQRIIKLSFINSFIQQRQIRPSTIARNLPLLSQSNAISSYGPTSNDSKQNSITSMITKLFNVNLFKHITVILTTIFVLTKQAFAASTAIYKSSTASNGWDIYGRVPYDDWLFTNWRLTDPNLLRRSYVECVSSSVYAYIYCI